MTLIKEQIDKLVQKGFTINQAENLVGQSIILNKIAKSPLANNILIKGGVVMFNLTHNLRRATSDLDFDFIKYDISENSIKKFIFLLNKFDQKFEIYCYKIDELHQEDYHGKRVLVSISDGFSLIKFKMDIGVHTLLDIKQDHLCFYFENNESCILKVNPSEQMFAEKAYSLYKHTILSTRFKDIYDMYYLINEKLLNSEILKHCFDLLLNKHSSKKQPITVIIDSAISTFSNKYYLHNFETDKDKWLDIDSNILFSSIVSYLKSLA